MNRPARQWQIRPPRDSLELVVLSVVATCLRSEGLAPRSRSVNGYLLGAPTIGRTMVLFREGTSQRTVTTSVRRVLRDDASDTLYVETENSLYRIDVTDYEPFAAAS